MKKTSLAILAAAALFAACTQVEQPASPSNGREIKFNASVGKYSLKATDTSFENGDQVTIIAYEPINAVAKYTYSDGSFKSDTPICWADGQTDSSIFMLMYPYLENYTLESTSLIFSVNADQSTHALYTASDLMRGSAFGSPAKDNVCIPVDHLLSKVRIFVDNNTDKTIQDVYLSDVFGQIDIINDMEPYGKHGTIKACPVKIEGQNAWTLIIVPQTTLPELMITMTDGTQYTYTLPDKFTFNSGSQATARVTLSENSIFTSFTADITDWTNDNDLQFGQDDPNAGWNYLGAGHYMEDVICNLFSGIGNYELECDVYEDASIPGRYKFVDPYKNWPYASSFGYTDGGYIILNDADGDGKAYIEESFIGLQYNSEPITIQSYCTENDWEAESYLWTTYTAGSWIGDGVVAHINSGYYICGANYMVILTLPGVVRQPACYTPYAEYQGPVEDEGVKYASLYAKPDIDLSTVRGAIFEGPSISYTDCCDSILNNTASNMVFEITNNHSNEGMYFDYPLDKLGVYYFMVAGDGYYNGEYCWGYWYNRFGYVPAGEEAPACEVALFGAAPSDANPGNSVTVYATCQNLTSALIVAIPAAKYGSMSEDEISNYLETYGDYVRGSSANFAGEGQKIQIDGLEPETEYVLVLRATNYYDAVGIATTTVTTGSSYTFTELGTGKYFDFIIKWSVPAYGFDDYYVSDVVIEQESTGKPIYRVHKPYETFWQYATDTTYYTHGESDYIEFYTKEYDSGTYVFFQPYYNGVADNVDGTTYPLLYKHYSGDIYANPEKYLYTCQNIQLSEGVFQLAPAVVLEGSIWIYPYYSSSEVAVICLPGYSYTPECDQTKAGASKPSHIMQMVPEETLLEDAKPTFVKSEAPAGTAKKAASHDFSEVNPDVKHISR